MSNNMMNVTTNQTVYSGGNNTGNNIDFKATFLGEVQLKPLRFNPSKEELIDLQGLTGKPGADYVREPNYERIDNGGKTQHVISLFCEFRPGSPNNVLDQESRLEGCPDKRFVSIDITVSPEKYVSGTGKVLLIDDKNISCWATDEGDPKTSILTARSMRSDDNYRALIDINENTARYSFVGEVDLYNLLFAMSDLLPFRRKKDGSLDGIQDGFHIGQKVNKNGLSEKGLLIANGATDLLNELVSQDLFKPGGATGSVTEDRPCNITAMLGVTATEKGDVTYYNQRVITFPRIKCIAQEGSWVRDVTENSVEFKKTQLSKEFLKALTDASHPTKIIWGKSNEFTKFNPSNSKEVNSGITSNDDDDLPF